MKKVIFVLVTVVSFVTVNAQFTFGPRAGINIARQNYGDSYVKTAYHVFPLGGLFLNYALGKHFAAQTEVMYAAEGTKFKYPSNAVGGTVTYQSGVITNNYVNIPLLVQYKHKTGIYVESGPQVSLLLSAHQKYSTGLKQDVKERTQSMVFSWSVGGGYDLDQLLSGLSAGIRYAAALTPTTKGSDIKGHAFSIAVSYAVGCHTKNRLSHSKQKTK